MIPGIGVGFGFGGGPMKPGALSAGIQAILGGTLTALAIGDDIVATGSVLTSWAPRVGASISYPDSNRFAVGAINGRRCLSSAASNPAALVTVQASHADEVWVVAQAATVSPANYRCAAMAIISPSAAAQRMLLHQQSAASWYAAGATAWYRDGSVSNAIDTNPHVYSGVPTASTDTTTLYIGNDSGALATRSWDGLIGTVLTTHGSITTQQRNDVTSILRTYYKF